MPDKYEVDIDITQEAKDRIAAMFKESLVKAKVDELTRQPVTLQQETVARAMERQQMLGTANSAAKGVGSVVSGGMGGALGAASMLGPEAAAVSELISTVFNTIKDAVNGLLSFVKTFNPAGVQMFDDALNDINGVIGRALNPALQQLVPLVRSFGDFLATVIPDLSDFFDAFSPIKDLFREVATLMSGELKGAFQDIINFVTTLVRVLTGALALLAAGLHKVNALLGNKLASSVGAAASGATSSGLEEFGTKLQLAAFGGPANLADSAQTTADNTTKMVDYMSSLMNVLRWAVRLGHPGAGV